MPRRRPRDCSCCRRLGDAGGDDGGVGHAVTWARMARASAPPSTWTSSPKRAKVGPSNGCLSMTSNSSPGAMPAVGQVAQHLRVGVRDAHEGRARPGGEVGQRAGRALLHHEVRRGDRVAVRVDRRIAELGRDERLELLGEDVLEDLGLGVDAIPRHVERLGEVELEQAVVADDLERHALAVGGQLDALVGHVVDQARARPGACTSPTPTPAVTPRRSASAFVVAGPSLALSDRVNRLRIVLNCW